MSETGRILVVGDVMTDVICLPDGPIVKGSDRRAIIRSHPGGSGANQAVWLGAIGAPVALAARVGEADREMYRNYFRGLGVVPLLGSDRTSPTGVLVTIVDGAGERSFLTDRGANLNLCEEDLPETLLDTACMVVASGYSYFAEGPRQAVIALVEAARQRGLPTVIDPASVGFLREVGATAFLDWTRGASLLLANVSEAETLSGSEALEEQMRRLGQDFERVVIKRGGLGAALGDATGIICNLPAPPVPVVDTTGAGDAFAAGFLAAELEGAPAEACLQRGIETGARAVGQLGGQPSELERPGFAENINGL